MEDARLSPMLVKLLALGAAGEAATGIILATSPAPFIRLLLGADLSGAGIALGRLAGFALIALGVACWPPSGATTGKSPALLAMAIYGFLAAVYLIVLGLDGALVGVLLWPAAAAHAALTLVLAQALLTRRNPR
jgi:hypothetical protein